MYAFNFRIFEFLQARENSKLWKITQFGNKLFRIRVIIDLGNDSAPNLLQNHDPIQIVSFGPKVVVKHCLYRIYPFKPEDGEECKFLLFAICSK